MPKYLQDIKDKNSIMYTHHVLQNPNIGLFSMHSHNVFELIYIRSGDVSYVIEDRKYKLAPDCVVISRPSDYHFIEINSPAEYNRQAILFDGKVLGVDMSMLPRGLDILSAPEGSVIRGIWDKLDLYSEIFTEEKFIELLKLLTKELIYNLSIAESDAELRINKESSPVLTSALKYIKEHLFDIEDISEIAQAVFVTESYLFRLFKAHLHQSPKKYIRDKRMLKAQRMLWEGKRPTAVAAQCGFSDYATFYRNYVSFFGIPPSNKNFDFQLTKSVD